MQLYEHCVESPTLEPFTLMNFDYGPARRLVNLPMCATAAATTLAGCWSRSPRPPDFPDYPEDYVAQMRMQGLAAAARQLVEIGFPTDAVPLYNQVLAAAESITENSPNYIGNREGVIQSAGKGLDQAMQGLQDEQLVRTVRGLLEPPAKARGKDQGEGQPKPASATPKGRDQAIDLVLLIHPRELDKAAVRSLFADSVAAGARDRRLLESIEGPLKSLREHNPSTTCRSGSPAAGPGRRWPRICEADPRRARRVGRAGRPHAAGIALGGWARQHPPSAEAGVRQVPFSWLDPRACWKQQPRREQGDRFATRATEAAGRQSDTRWVLAMLRERGQSALDRGDTKEVDAAWGRMLDMILARKLEEKSAAEGARGWPGPRPSLRRGRTPQSESNPAPRTNSAATAMPGITATTDPFARHQRAHPHRRPLRAGDAGGQAGRRQGPDRAQREGRARGAQGWPAGRGHGGPDQPEGHRPVPPRDGRAARPRDASRGRAARRAGGDMAAPTGAGR